MPIVSSEWGYSTASGGLCTSVPTAQLQGDYLARTFLVNLSQGIPLSIWYDLKDDGPDPSNYEDNFGTVTADFVPKPAYNEMQLLTNSLKGETFTKRLTTGLLERLAPGLHIPQRPADPGGLDHGKRRILLPCRVGGRFTLTSTPFYVNPTLEPGDANLDGTVNFTDLNIVLTNYNQAGGWMQGDFNHDGVVNFADLNILLTNYNQSFAGATIAPASYGLDAAAIRALSLAGVTVVPEPGALVMLAVALIGAWRILGGDESDLKIR